eukprot:COSAG06_NODE_34394_length_475_cov_0.888298_1_plen_79_part_00
MDGGIVVPDYAPSSDAKPLEADAAGLDAARPAAKLHGKATAVLGAALIAVALLVALTSGGDASPDPSTGAGAASSSGE